MAGHQALAAAGRSVVTLLNRRFRQLQAPDPLNAVLVGTTDLDQVNQPGSRIVFPSVAVFCYRLSVDRETRPAWSAVAARDGVPRLPLRMHLLVTAFDDTVESELEWLGLAARILEEQSVLAGGLLDPAGGWAVGDQIQLTTDDMALESMSEAFQALTADFRLYLLYQARVIVIEGDRTATDPLVTTVAAGPWVGTA